MWTAYQSGEVDQNGDQDNQKDHHDYGEDAALLLLAGHVLLPPLNQVLVGLVHVAVGAVDVVLHLVQLTALRVDHVLHVLLHLQGVHHPPLDLFDLLLLYLDHALVVKRLLVHLVHLYLDRLAVAVVVLLAALRYPGFSDFGVCVEKGVLMLLSVFLRLFTLLFSNLYSWRSYSWYCWISPVMVFLMAQNSFLILSMLTLSSLLWYIFLKIFGICSRRASFSSMIQLSPHFYFLVLCLIFTDQVREVVLSCVSSFLKRFTFSEKDRSRVINSCRVLILYNLSGKEENSLG